jgi:hypothetical protein
MPLVAFVVAIMVSFAVAFELLSALLSEHGLRIHSKMLKICDLEGFSFLAPTIQEQSSIMS